MASIKDAAIETIKKMPDECTVEDIMYEINFIAQVMDGLRDAEGGSMASARRGMQPRPRPGLSYAREAMF